MHVITELLNLDYGTRAWWASGITLAAPVYCYIVAGAFRPGVTRLLLSLPAICALYALPCLFSHDQETLTVMGLAYMTSRLPAPKLLALCLGRGVLQQVMHLTGGKLSGLLGFVTVASCPVATMPGRAQTEQTSSSHNKDASTHSLDKEEDSHKDMKAKHMTATTALQPAYSREGPAPVAKPQQLIEHKTPTNLSLWTAIFTNILILSLVCATCRVLNLGSVSFSSLTCKAQNSTYVQQLCNVQDKAINVLQTWGNASLYVSQHAVAYCVKLTTRFLQALGMYYTMCFLLDLTLVSVLARVPKGMKVVAAFNNCFQSASLSEFWGQRWNLPQTQLLKALVYDVVMDGHLIRHDHRQPHQPGSRHRVRESRKAAGVMATFTFSGLEHLLFNWYVTHQLYWPWLWFFVLQGGLVLLETSIKRSWRNLCRKQSGNRTTPQGGLHAAQIDGYECRNGSQRHKQASNGDGIDCQSNDMTHGIKQHVNDQLKTGNGSCEDGSEKSYLLSVGRQSADDITYHRKSSGLNSKNGSDNSVNTELQLYDTNGYSTAPKSETGEEESEIEDRSSTATLDSLGGSSQPANRLRNGFATAMKVVGRNITSGLRRRKGKDHATALDNGFYTQPGCNGVSNHKHNNRATTSKSPTVLQNMICRLGNWYGNTQWARITVTLLILHLSACFSGFYKPLEQMFFFLCPAE